MSSVCRQYARGPGGPGSIFSAWCAARLHSCLLCISLDTLILSNYKEFLINFVASAPKDPLSARALYFNLVILLLFVFKGQTAERGMLRSCWNWGWGEGKERKADRPGICVCCAIPLPACGDSWLLTFMTATRYPATQNRTRAGTRLLSTSPDPFDISDRAVKDS